MSAWYSYLLLSNLQFFSQSSPGSTSIFLIHSSVNWWVSHLLTQSVSQSVSGYCCRGWWGSYNRLEVLGQEPVFSDFQPSLEWRLQVVIVLYPQVTFSWHSPSGHQSDTWHLSLSTRWSSSSHWQETELTKCRGFRQNDSGTIIMSRDLWCLSTRTELHKWLDLIRVNNDKLCNFRKSFSDSTPFVTEAF